MDWDCERHNLMLIIPVDTFFSVFFDLPSVRFSGPPRSFAAALLCYLPSKGGYRTVISHSSGVQLKLAFGKQRKPAHKCVPTSR
ncbi:MAG: hypothetical protein KHW62_00325 [Clostridiales bacterium]|nr:hypothetical protein [Clostridiales bacterium]